MTADRTEVHIPSDCHPDFGPWQSVPRLAILIPCGDRPKAEILATTVDILGSTFQNFAVSISDAPSDCIESLTVLLREDSRFAVSAWPLGEVPAARFVLVLPAGWRLTRYSLEALLSAVQLPTVAVVRVLVEGHSRPVEIWDRDYLVHNGAQHATRMARIAGLERWIDGSSLGLYAHGHQAPKVFFRKGPADRHILEFVVYDSRNEAFKQSQRSRILTLERQIRVLKSRSSFTAGERDAHSAPNFLRTLRTLIPAKVAGIIVVLRGRTK